MADSLTIIRDEMVQSMRAYMEQQAQLYGQQQDLLAYLTPLLQQEISNPVGFSAEELANLNASNVNTTGAQYANIQKQLNLANSSRNMAGLTSGVAAGETAALQSAAAGTVATNASNINLASAQLGQQKSQIAQGQLLAMQSGLGGEAISMGQLTNQANKLAFDETVTRNALSSQLMNGILGGLANAGLGIATGGISTGIQAFMNQGGASSTAGPSEVPAGPWA